MTFSLLLYKVCHATLAKAALVAVLFLLALVLVPAGVVALIRDWRALNRPLRGLGFHAER